MYNLMMADIAAETCR